MTKQYGERVTLKTPVLSDLKYIQSLWADPVTMKEVGGVYIYTDDEIRVWYERIIINGGDAHLYFLIYDENNRPIGEISFHDYKVFNVKIAHSHRGNGYFKEATLIFLKHYFDVLGRCEIVDDIAINNTVSHELFLSLGFEHMPEYKDVFYVRMSKEKYRETYGQ